MGKLTRAYEEAIERAFDEAAIQLGRAVGSDLRATLRARFEQALAGDVGDALRRSAHAAWDAASLEVLPEHPVLGVLDDGLIRGRIDRLVLGRDAHGAVIYAAVLDYKSGRVDSEQDRIDAEAWYAPQLDRYAAGVSRIWSIPLEHVETAILFVE